MNVIDYITYKNKTVVSNTITPSESDWLELEGYEGYRYFVDLTNGYYVVDTNGDFFMPTFSGWVGFGFSSAIRDANGTMVSYAKK